MSKDNSLLAIDIGSSNLRMAEFVYGNNNSVTMTKFDIRRLDINPEDGEDADVIAFLKLYHEMIQENHFTAKKVRISLSPKLSFQKLSKLPPVSGSRAAIDKIVALEAKQTVPYAINDVEWGYQLICHKWQEKRNETQEDGSVVEVVDDNEEFEALFVAVKSDQISCYTDIIQDSGKKIVSVEIAPLTLFNSGAITQVNKDECVLILNIGGSCSSLMISDNNRAFIRTIPIAGDAITNQIAKEFGIPFKDAEEMKIRHGFVALGGAYEEPESELAATISKITRNVMTRLHGEISRSVNVWRAQHGGGRPAKILLAGGGATMLYMTDFFQEKLRVPAEYLNTFGIVGLADSVDKEKLQNSALMTQELIGLSISGVQCPVYINLLPKAIQSQYTLDRRKPYFYSSALVLISCLFLFGLMVSMLLSREDERLKRVRIKVDETAKVADSIKQLQGELNGAKAQFEELSNLFKERDRFAAILRELQSMLPDMVYLVSLECSDVIPPPDSKQIVPASENQYGDSSSQEQRSNISLDVKDVREIKYIILKGYTLNIRNVNPMLANSKNMSTPNWVREFRNRLTKSTVFQDNGTLQDNRSSGNLTGFSLVLALKEPIKK